MAGAQQAAQHVWKEWGIQLLVLLSFTLQVALLVLAELRRRIDSAVLRLFVWSAYMLADATAIYALGHMSVSSMRPEHQLMALWAPLLLMHLGGQDNITAYAIEDNKLWLRHLQTLAVQVAAAAYVLYESSILSGAGGGPSSSARLRRATILMFSVGVVKYGERVWALRCAGCTPSGTKYRTFQTELISTHTAIHLDQIAVSSSKRLDAEACLLMAQRLVHIPKNLLKGPLPSKFDFRGAPDLCGEDQYRVVEMQLSVMHDIFYTKAEVMHTWYAPFIRTFSLLGTASAFWLFHLFCRHHHRSLYSRVDVTVTYALLAGALVLEMTSALRGLFSSWLCVVLVCVGGPLGTVLVSLRRLVRAADWRSRYWSGSLGQHNLLQLCARSRASRISKVASWIGVEDWWNTLAYSGSIQISASIEQLVLEQVLKSKGVPVTSSDHILNSRGRAALKSCRLHQGLEWSVDPDSMGLEESILAWHIATNVYLSWYKDREQAVVEHVGREKMVPGIAKAIDALSNYMLFLLAARPFMLSPTASRNAYVEMCYGLTALQFSSPKDLTSLLRRYGDALNGSSEFEFVFLNRYSVPQSSLRNNETLKTGCKLGAKLVSEEMQDSPAQDTLKLIAQVWVEMLCYASRQCSAYSHAKQLGNGGELATVAAILVEHVTTNPQYEWIEEP
ncbi:unnamed protein product [Urochloa humidicola]